MIHGRIQPSCGATGHKDQATLVLYESAVLTAMKNRPSSPNRRPEWAQTEESRYMNQKMIPILFLAIYFFQLQVGHANPKNGEKIYLARCAMCHGANAKGTGPLAQKSNPPTPDLTTADFRKRLANYPGVIVSSIVLRPNGDLIPKTLRENGVNLPPFPWTLKDLRDLNEYMSGLIASQR